MSESLADEPEEKAEISRRSILAKARGTLAYTEDLLIPIEVQAKIEKIVEDLTTKLVEAKLRSIVAEKLVEIMENKSQGRYSKGSYMSAGLSAFAGLVGYAYFGGVLGLLLIAAAAGPFLMSLLGLYRSQE